MEEKPRRAPKSRRKPASTPARSGGRRADRALSSRLAALEDRVARLETGRAAPGDGRGAARKGSTAARCPGCGLPLRRKAGRCAECGRPLRSF